MNDPNGVIHWGGDYHLFYQFHPESPRFRSRILGACRERGRDSLAGSAGRARSNPRGTRCNRLLVRLLWWTTMDVPTAVYTGVGPQGYGQQSQCIATSQDGLLTWEKYSGNPILSEIPAISNQPYDLRDPMIWREGDTWYMLLASRIQTASAVPFFLYRSPDLIQWEFLHPLLTGELC